MLLYSTIIDASVEGFAFTGFDWRRRSLSASTFARGEGNTANKQLILTRVASLDSGKDHLQQWRDDTTGYISDQGAGERGVHCAPHGDRAEVREVLRLVRQGGFGLELRTRAQDTISVQRVRANRQLAPNVQPRRACDKVFARVAVVPAGAESFLQSLRGARLQGKASENLVCWSRQIGEASGAPL